MGLASMGPRSRERGKPSAPVHYRSPKRPASMGPRSRERGKQSRVFSQRSLTKLQWGRAHVSAERNRWCLSWLALNRFNGAALT